MSTTNHRRQEPGNAGAFERRVCADCSSPFVISERELAWLESRSLQPFRRCGACRAARRLAGGPAASSVPHVRLSNGARL